MISPEKFEDYGIQGVNLGRGGNQMVFCPKCHEDRSSKSRRKKELSVKVAEGVWNCHHCQWKGRLSSKVQGAKHQDWTPPELAKQQTPTENALRWLQSRGVTQEVAERNKIAVEARNGEKTGTFWVCFNYISGGNIVNVKKRGHPKEFSQSPGGMRTLYKVDDLRGQREAIITEGELDALSFEVAGYQNAASLPDGAVAPGQDASGKFKCLDVAADVLSGIERYYLALDSDESGVYTREELARRLGRHKCLIVRYPDGCKDANDVLVRHGAAELAACIRDASPYPVQDVVFAADVQEGYDALYERGHEKGATTGYMSELDQHVSFHPGHLTVVTGAPNSGKSVVIDQILLRLCIRHEWRLGIFTPEMYPPEHHLSGLAMKLNGKQFLPGYNGRMSKDEAQQALDWLNDRLAYIYPSGTDFTLDDVLAAAAQVALRYGLDCLVIDPWNKLDHQFSKGETETQYISRALDKLTHFAAQYGCHVIVIAHPAKLRSEKPGGKKPIPTLYDISGSANFYNKCYLGITVYRDQDVDESTGKIIEKGTQIHVQKVKHNWMGKQGGVLLRYNARNGRYHEEGNEPDDSSWIAAPQPTGDPGPQFKQLPPEREDDVPEFKPAPF